VFQAAAEASPFNGGVDYRKVTAAAVYDPSTMPPPGSRVRAGSGRRPSEEGRVSARTPVTDPDAELDWAGNPVHRSSKAHVPKPAEVRGAHAHTSGLCVCVCLGACGVPGCCGI
jgi:hypothetical protein